MVKSLLTVVLFGLVMGCSHGQKGHDSCADCAKAEKEYQASKTAHNHGETCSHKKGEECSHKKDESCPKCEKGTHSH